MLHTRVWCRARAWDVVDERCDGDVTWWRLRRDHDPPRLLASPPDTVRPLCERARRVSPRAWARAMRAHLQAAMPSWWPAAWMRLPIDRLAWQGVPAMVVLSGRHRRVLLADPVGMGKTVQAALLLREVHDRDPDAATLVVAPAGLIAQWASELRERAGLEAAIVDAARLRAEAPMPARLVDEARRGACWIVSIDLVRQPDARPLFTRTAWTLLVVDEAHAAAPATARLDALRALAASSARLLLLSGTPTAAGPAGLEALRSLGSRPGEAPMPVLRREPARRGPPRRTCVLHVRLDRAHASVCTRLDAFAARARAERGGTGLLPALVLRRRAASCPRALVRSLERRLMHLGDGPAQRLSTQPTLWDDMDAHDEDLLRMPAWGDSSAERAELESLLAQARALSPHGRKIAVVGRLLRRCREPAVVFTTYLDTARALRDRLAGVRLALVHGQLPDALRAQAIEAFTSGEVDVLVTTDASAEGVNLHSRCRLVVHADLPGSARLLTQRTGRVDRLGQPCRVHEVLLSSGAAEDVERLARLQTSAAEDEGALDRRVCGAARRTRLAEACLTRAHAARLLSPGDGPTHVRCALAPARWRRVRRRWRLPVDARALRVSQVTVSGRTLLAGAQVPVVEVLGEADPPVATHAARLLVGQLRRARARARRLDAWHHVAGTTAAVERARTATHDLFIRDIDDGRAPEWADAPALTRRVYGEIGVRLPEDAT